MATVQTVNFSSAIIDGTNLEFSDGQLTFRTDNHGMHSWDAGGVLRGDPSMWMQLMQNRGMVEAEFATRERGLLSGTIFVSRLKDELDGRVLLGFQGTGPLKGWGA
ncbi:MAG: hypothetical protein ACHQ01_07990 [Candidatus Limnocylindrales bacterium]